MFRFVLHESYIDEVACDVVPLDYYQVILGSCYLGDGDASLHKRDMKYTFMKDSKKVVIRSLPKSQGTSIEAAAQEKRLVNVCEKFTLLENRK